MSDENRTLLVSAAAVVTGVAVAAAVQSFTHLYGIGRTHGQSELDCVLLAISVDGLILAMALVIIHEAQDGRPAPFLAWLMLWLGVAATIAANVFYGLPFGPVGALYTAWPAAAFLGSVHAVLHVVRDWRQRTGSGTDNGRSPRVPTDSVAAAELAFLSSVTGGNPFSENQLVTNFGITRSQARKIRQPALVMAGSQLNGAHSD